VTQPVAATDDTNPSDATDAVSYMQAIAYTIFSYKDNLYRLKGNNRLNCKACHFLKPKT